MSLIGLDIGTTGCKAIIFDQSGNIATQASAEYPILTPFPGWAEQDAEVVYTSAIDCLKKIIAKIKDDPPTAMALSCQGEAVTPVDADGNPLRNTILGMDTRTVKENLWLCEKFGPDELFQKTGMPVHTINTLPKLLWLQKNEKELWKKADQFLLYEDFFIRRLFGGAAISHCLASRTQMYDLHKGEWAEQLLEKCGIESIRLAQLAPATGVLGELTPAVLNELGLKDKVTLVAGGHDQACAALGSGVAKNGLAMVSTGTAEVVEVAMEKLSLTKKLQYGGISIYKHVVPDLFLAMTLNHSGGLVLRWYRDQFGEKEKQTSSSTGKDAYDLILQDAPDGPTDLFVLPHFSGSGTPTLDTQSRGAILGLCFTSTKASIAKAMLEGLTFELKINIELLQNCGIQINKLHAVGGGAKSDLWLHLKADICDLTLVVPKVTEAACLGAVILAGVATGIYKDYDAAIGQIVSVKKTVEPNPVLSRQYDNYYRQYKKIYPALRTINYRLNDLKSDLVVIRKK